MNRRKSNIVVMILLGLGVLGFVYTLFTNPGSLLVQAGMIFLFVGIIFLLYKFVIGRRMGGKDHSAYLRAAKQSKKRFKAGSQRKSQIMGVGNKKTTSNATKRSTVSSIHKKRKTNTTHLTVIEGKKGKKKNRALF
ncbi:SA1362 family protein [Bacillus sinesaloumensis]|uniref:SA1362 family protein n=1 Tax=Litchfieldia sinesaloumensis TaxID=1926280 RepID=UPI0009886E61|nr:SA1362 family protein [Bacillus sinesaloumensis]